MEFRVLGPIEVLDDHGRVIEIGPKMQRAVLAMLIMEANRVVSLDRLIDCLWGDQPPATATTALQVYISQLRRLFEPDRPPRTRSRAIVTRPPGYLLEVETDRVDAARFESLCALGGGLLDAGQAAEARQTLQEAVTLWRGSAYADFAYDPFVGAEIARLHELRAVVAERLVEAELALGWHASVTAELGRLAGEEPLRERRWELLALAHYRCGRQGDALRVLAHARRILGEELGIEPGPSLRQLELDILTQSASLEWRPRRDRSRQAVALAVPDGVTQRSVSQPRPLVGRQTDVAELTAAFDASCARQGGFALVAGEPGIGKTRLAEEMAERGLARGAIVAWGRCHETEIQPAFWPWIQILRSLVTEGESEAVRGALSGGAAAIARLVPEVKEFVDAVEAPPLLDAAEARARLYEAAGSFLRRLSAHRPLMLVIDDLHWADVASLELLQALTAQIRDHRVLVICTYRDLEADMKQPVLATLALLARQSPLTRIEPVGLTEGEVHQLVEAATRAKASQGLAEAIHARTEGNPLFVSELVRLLVSRRQLGTGAEEAVRREIPAGIRETIRLRLARLPDEAVALLRVAAVVGWRFDLDTVAAAADLDYERTLELAEAGLIVGLVVETGNGFGSYQFSHAVVRDTLYDGLSHLRRARLHMRVGAALEHLHADDPPLVELAHHFLQAAPMGGVDKAISYALQVADRAASGLAFEQAEEQLHRALQLLSATPPTRERRRRELEVQIRLGTVIGLTEGYASAGVGRAVTRAEELSDELGDTAPLLAALWRVLVFANVGGHVETTRRIGCQLLDIGRRTGDRSFLIAGHWGTGDVALWDGRLSEARDELQRAIQLADGFPDGALAAVMMHDPSIAARTIQSLVCWLLGDSKESECAITEAVRRARAASPMSLVDSLFFQAVVRAFAGDALGVVQSAEEALALAEELGLRLYDASICLLRGWARASLGEPDAGLTELEGGLTGVRATGTRMLSTFFLGLMADARLRAGRTKEALETTEEALTAVEEIGERFWEAELHRLRGELLADSADAADEAAISLQRALDVARIQGAQPLEARIADTLARHYDCKRNRTKVR